MLWSSVLACMPMITYLYLGLKLSMKGTAQTAFAGVRCITSKIFFLWLPFRTFKSSFIFVFALLRPEDLFQDDCSDHHPKDEAPHKYQCRRHYTTDDLDLRRFKCLANGKCRGNECRIGEDIRVPGHIKNHSVVTNARPMCTD